MSSPSKLVISSCVFLGTASIAGLAFNMCSKSDEDKESEGATTESKPNTCGCPFANSLSVGLFSGLLTGAMTWVFYSPQA
uniref:Uncharacterized protein n=1 Tax=viral metagenome TaxID=1070528 RepID=A0A6C0BZ81_9ZZZZ